MLLTKDFKLSIETKAGAAEGVIAGKASVYGVLDSYRDIVMPGAFTESLAAQGNRVPILNQHNTHDPIGIASLADTTDALLISEGILELGLQSARDAYLRASKGLVTGISIGYEVAAGGEKFQGDNRLLTKINLWEVSLVTFPANAYCQITEVKSEMQRAIGDMEFVDWALAERKAGRVLSAANLTRMKSAMDAMAVAMRSMQEVLDAAAPAPADDAIVDEALSASGQELKSLGILMADIRRTFTK